MRKGRGTLKLAAAFLGFAIVIKLLSSGFFKESVKNTFYDIASEGELLRYAVSEESQLLENDSQKKLFGKLISETTLVPAEASDVGISEEREELVVWEYTPGGEKKEKVYPVENITISPKSASGYVMYENIWVKNDSSKGIDLKWLLSAKLPFKLSGDGPHVLIVHTHASECYFPQGKETYTLTDVERTSDKKYNMIRVGDELEKTLRENGISVIHDRNIYDSPSYNGSYTRTLDAIGKALRENPSIKVVIDLHRDAMTTEDGVKYRTVTEIDGKRLAQMMIVMSTGESGLPHPDWAENLKLAVKLQNALAGKYKDLMRPINLRKERFNMHATQGSMLVEVGTSANSLAEAIGSVQLLGKELAPILKTAK